MAVTRKEIAAYAGVSAATVTNVFNHSKAVSNEIRTKVMQAAEALRYTQRAKTALRAHY